MRRDRLEIRPSALKSMKRLDKPVRRRIQRAVDRLRKDPRPAGVPALKDRPGLLRIRVGDYRVVYTVDDGRVLVLVVALGHRSTVYRDLA